MSQTLLYLFTDRIDSGDTVTAVLCAMYRHFQRKHRAQFSKYLSASSKDNADDGSSTLSSFLTERSSDSYGASHPLQKKFTHSLVNNLIVGCGLPMSVVEKPAFKAFISDVSPKLCPPSRQFVTYKALPELAEMKKTALQHVLDSASYVALTLDIWTDRSCHSFLGVTAHTFHECVHESGLLTFRAFTGSHTGIRIAEEIEKCVTENSLEGKVSYVVTDNASNMKRAFDVLRELHEDVTDQQRDADEGVLDDETMWEDIDADGAALVQQTVERICSDRLSCFAHSLQLVVKDGLSKINVGPTRLVTAKCSKICNMVHQSAVFRSAFEEHFGAGRSLPKANDTRWNSTFHHLSKIACLETIKLASLLKSQNQSHLILTPKEHAILQELVDLLQPFCEATDLTQGESQPTIGCVVPAVVSLDACLTEFIPRAVHHIMVARALQESLRRRFHGLFQRIQILPSAGGEIDVKTFGLMLYPMASVLDPSYGFLWLEDHPSSDDEKRLLKDEIIGNIASLFYDLYILSHYFFSLN